MDQFQPQNSQNLDCDFKQDLQISLKVRKQSQVGMTESN